MSRPAPASPGSSVGPPLRVCVVSSVGGHLREILELAPAWQGAAVRFIVNDHTAVPLPGPVHRIAHAERDARVLWNFGEAVRIFGGLGGDPARAERPDVIVSAGAGPAVPVAVVGRLLGAAVVFVETFGAVQRPSLTGRIMYPLTPHFFYQWPALAAAYPRGRYAGPVFCRDVTTAQPEPSAEIVVTVGTSDRPFSRLLGWLDDLSESGELTAPLFAQRGTSAAPRHFPSVPLLPAPELEARLRKARVVICHAGAGALGTCIKHGLRPLIVPRLLRHGEAVNDHQLELATALAAEGRAVLCPDRPTLATALRTALATPQGGRLNHNTTSDPTLLREVATLLHQLASTRGRSLSPFTT